MDVEAKVKELIVDKLNVDEEELTDEATFTGDLGADSLDTVEMIMALEEEFDIEIEDEVAETLTTVGKVINYIKESSK